MEQPTLTMITDEGEYSPVTSGPIPETVVVQCPICNEVIEVPQYDSITRSDALKRHIKEKHTSFVSNQASNFHELMLHAVAEMYKPGGIVVNKERAMGGPCRCVEYKPGRKLCFSPGIVGALSNTQEKIYCKEYEKMDSPGIERRMEKWQACVNRSKDVLPPEDGATRLEVFLMSMSECLSEP